MTQIRRQGKVPRHQNTTAFKHNKGSKKTQQIASTPNVGLCKRCHDVIEWKKQYRKYKPLTQPRRCNYCNQKTVTLAYHVICDPCAKQKKVCAKCNQAYDEKLITEVTQESEIQELENIEKQMIGLSLRKQHTIIRGVKEKMNKDNDSGEESFDEEDDEEDDDELVPANTQTNKKEVNNIAKIPQKQEEDSEAEEDFSDEDDDY
ncbi:hypothetical protein ABK040_009318 [Willaertia magna]